MKQDKRRACRFTTMLDLYGLRKDFPGYQEATYIVDPYERVRRLESDIYRAFNDFRFLPYIQLHEFEALILADPHKLAPLYPECQAGIARLAALTENQNPELINEGRDTAPSKRIMQEIPLYNKIIGAGILGEIGLPPLRSRCSHFNRWLSALERLSRTLA